MKATIAVPFLFIVVAIAAMEVQGTEDNEPASNIIEELGDNVKELGDNVKQLEEDVEEAQDTINTVTDPDALTDALNQQVEEAQQEAQQEVQQEAQNALDEQATEVHQALEDAAKHFANFGIGITPDAPDEQAAQGQREKPTGAKWLAGGFLGLGLISLAAIKAISWSLNRQRRKGGRKDGDFVSSKKKTQQRGAQEKEPQWRL